jgi:cysteine desulfurase
LIVGLGKAAEIALADLSVFETEVRRILDFMEQEILSTIPDSELNGHRAKRLPNTSNITIPGVESEALLMLLDSEGVCASSGSACLADSDEPSHVIKAMKPKSSASREMIRLSLGADNSLDEIKVAVKSLRNSTFALRS